MAKRPKKLENVLDLVRRRVDEGAYLFLSHAVQRGKQGGIVEPEVVYVLLNGWHEKRKDEFKEEYRTWTYAIRGRTIEERNLRVAVAFDPSELLIVTVIDLDREN